MRIENNRQYFAQNTGLGTKLKINTEKDVAQIYSRDTVIKPNVKNDSLESSPLRHFTRANNNMLKLGGESKIHTIGNELVVENDDDMETNADLEIINAKRTKMNNLLQKMGVKGQLTAVSHETVPQNYTTYYVEAEGDAKNLFIIELENGEFIFTETNHDDRTLTKSFGESRYSLIGIDEGKLSVDELKKAFASFFDIDQLKDFSLEFLGSDINKPRK
ncbi:MAG TPA: hypothetical protein GX707_15840 [Epulopiscium sp.]|nr:hypothetical protein [Candidatus Epulonipiscium sp.]